ncbi:Mur ligase domain-containing protein, partial [Xanthomonas fragariae]
MPLSQLLPEVTLAHDVQVSGLVMDSRAVSPGDAFVAIAGFGAHGLDFVEQARVNGAAVVLFEPPAPADLPAPADAIAVPGLRARLGVMANRFHGQPSHAMRMVGVTGTN